MKICWDNLEKLRYDKKKECWYHIITRNRYEYRNSCSYCGEPFFVYYNGGSKSCNRSCATSGKNHYSTNRVLLKKRIEKWRKSCPSFKGNENPFYGKKHSKKTREKWSINRKLEKSPRWGTKHSEKTLSKMRNVKLGQKNPMYGRIGSKSSNWRGGISKEPYAFIFGNKRWRSYIQKRDAAFFCWNPECFGMNTRQTLHHINYNKKDCNFINIITLCTSCNVRANYNKEYWKNHYTEIMNKRLDIQ